LQGNLVAKKYLDPDLGTVPPTELAKSRIPLFPALTNATAVPKEGLPTSLLGDGDGGLSQVAI
jgi:hypothetical protein